MVRSVGNDRLYREAPVAGDDVQRTAQRQYSLAHADQAETELVIRRQTAAIVADAHQGAGATSVHSCSLFHRYADGGRVGVAEGVCQGFLDGTIDRQVRDFSGLARRSGNVRLNGNVGTGLTPQTQEHAERLAKSKLRKPNRPQLFQYPAVELLERVDLLHDCGAMLA
jgi:hypothetical protein